MPKRRVLEYYVYVQTFEKRGCGWLAPSGPAEAPLTTPWRARALKFKSRQAAHAAIEARGLAHSIQAGRNAPPSAFVVALDPAQGGLT